MTITWQTGPSNHAAVLQLLGAKQREGGRLDVVPFIDDMAAAYRSSALVVSRAGEGLGPVLGPSVLP